MTDIPPPNQQLPADNDPPDETERSDRTRPVLQPAPPAPASQDAPARPPAARTGRRVPPGPQPQTEAGRGTPRKQPVSGQQRRSPRQAGAARVPVATPPVAPPSAPRQARRANQPSPAVIPSQSGLYLPWWSLVVLVGVVGGLAVGLVLVFATLSESQSLGDQAPRIQVITAQPTLSQDFGASNNSGPAEFWPTAIPQVQPEATVPLPTPIPSPSLPPGNFVIGARVAVVGVGANGLNVRSAPGYVGTPLFLAYEDEVFALVDGPQNADGLEWWKLEDPNDPSRVGWAARNYLTVR